MTPARICLIHASVFAAPLAAMGHEILVLDPPPGLFALAPELAARGFVPDVVAQQELLDRRTLVADLPAATALKVFLSLDTHLNLFWQAPYAKLFDLVLTTQPRWRDILGETGLANVKTLTWAGRAEPFVPFTERRTEVGFVGRLGPERPARRWMADFLKPLFNPDIRTDLPGSEVGPFYRNVRLVPNESIMGEVNMRLFEAASAGCLVLNQDMGPAVEEYFEPGREILVYRDALELAELLAHYRKRPAEAERLGRKAWERVQAEHLPVHRAERLLDCLAGAGRAAPGGEAARRTLILAVFELWQAGRLGLPAETVAGELAALPESPEAQAALLALLFSLGRREEILASLAGEVVARRFQADLGHSLAASVAALRLERFDLAKLFYLRRLKDLGRKAEIPDSPGKLLVLWSREAARAGRLTRPGFLYDSRRHLPACAADCLLEALEADQENLEAAGRLEEILERSGGMDPSRIGLLSHLTLRRRDDWRAALRLGMANLRNFRPGQGLEELLLARRAAQGKNETDKFERALSWMDKSGLAAKALRNG